MKRRAFVVLLLAVAAFAPLAVSGPASIDVDILFRAVDNRVPAGVDSALCYRTGDPITYKIWPTPGVDPPAWGTAEGPPRFWRVTVTGVPLNNLTTQILALFEAGVDSTVLDSAFVARIRQWTCDPADLQAGDEADLLADGLLTLTWQKFRNWFKDRGPN